MIGNHSGVRSDDWFRETNLCAACGGRNFVQLCLSGSVKREMRGSLAPRFASPTLHCAPMRSWRQISPAPRGRSARLRRTELCGFR